MFRNVLIASVVCFLVFISFLMTYAGQSMPVEIKAEYQLEVEKVHLNFQERAKLRAADDNPPQ